MDRFDDDTLFADLRALRPTPRPEFAAELDHRAAAGFPRRQAPSATAMPFALLAERWRALSPRRRLMPVLAVALATLVVATVVVAI
jgi:type II secretory pathway component PulM